MVATLRQAPLLATLCLIVGFGIGAYVVRHLDAGELRAVQADRDLWRDIYAWTVSAKPDAHGTGNVCLGAACERDLSFGRYNGSHEEDWR